MIGGCSGSKDTSEPAAPVVADRTAEEPAGDRVTSVPKVEPAKASQVPPAKKRPASAEWLGDTDSFSTQDLFAPGNRPPWRLPRIDEERVLAAGIGKQSGKYLTLYTDLRDNAAVEELPLVFDRAVAHWCEYFEVPVEQTDAWRMIGYLMLDVERFRRAGLLPADLPPFLNGYQRGAELWVYEQPTDYYRRHLLLHEGTHAFMQWAFGGCGPPWFMEGTAELIATHRWQNGELKLRHFPESKEDTPHWGRIKILKSDLAEGRGKTLQQVLLYDATAHLRVEPYAWCWAAAMFFDSHPTIRPPFRALRRHATDSSERFSQRFFLGLESEWPHLERLWQTFIFNVEYGYSLERERFEARPVQPLPDEGVSVHVVADRGWQSTGYRLERGARYRFDASGRYQVADQPKIWWCEPNGVTIRYYKGLPLGILLGAVVDEEQPPDGPSTLVTPSAIGSSLEAVMDRSGTLFLRINDSGAELRDNAGELTVKVRRME